MVTLLRAVSIRPRTMPRVVLPPGARPALSLTPRTSWKAGSSPDTLDPSPRAAALHEQIVDHVFRQMIPDDLHRP